MRDFVVKQHDLLVTTDVQMFQILHIFAGGNMFDALIVNFVVLKV